LWLAAFVGPAGEAVAQRGNPRGEAAPRGPAWRDWNSGLEEAARTGKPILVDVYTDWCGWCRVMDRATYAETAVRDYLTSRFVPVKLNPERSREAHAVASRFRVTGYPTTIFLKPNGEHLVTVPGYVKTDLFLTLLRFVAEGHFERGVPFETFRSRAETPR
jgi:thioredoxin-related protein